MPEHISQQPIAPKSVFAPDGPIRRTLILAVSAIALTALIGGLASQLWATDRTVSGQKKLKVDWGDAELKALPRTRALTVSGDQAVLAKLLLPVLAFSSVPQVVKNVYGPDAKPTVPRKIVTDPDAPYFYTIEDTYGDITITVSADVRINQESGTDFATSTPPPAVSPAPAAKITVSGGQAGEGEGVELQYTIIKFPNIPYTVNIECGPKAMAQCKDLAVVAKDQQLLKVLSVGRGQD
jgi:hypothetical protein